MERGKGEIMKLEDIIPIEEITLQKIRFAVAQHVYPQDLRYEVFNDYMTDRMTHMLT